MFWSIRREPPTRFYTVDDSRCLVYYRGWSLSLTLGWPLLDLAMDEIDAMIWRRRHAR